MNEVNHYKVLQDDVGRRLTTYLAAESSGDRDAGRKYQQIERTSL